MLACALSMLLIELMFALGKYKKDMYSKNYKKPNFNIMYILPSIKLEPGRLLSQVGNVPPIFKVENNTF